MKILKFFIITLLIFNLFLPFLFAQQQSLSIDQLMNPKERQRTGIDKLSISEKMELKEWVDKYCKRTIRCSNSTDNPEISQVIENGHFLTLTDNSIWQIHPKDIIITQSWITPAPIIIQKTGEGTYPYRLTNDITKSTVQARKITHVPEKYRSHIEFHQNKADYRQEK